MEIWQEGKIKDFADVKGGKRLPKGKQLIIEPNTHPYIRIRDLGKSKVIELTSDYEYVDDETQASIARYIVDKGDILISVVGTIGLIAIVGETLHKANQTENCDKITNLKGIDRDYLYYYLVSSFGQDEIKKGTVGAVQPKLPLKNVQDITIKYPSLETQRKIAELLSSLDRKIETNNQINRNLSEQVAAIYKSWFIDYDRNNGVCPDGWNEATLGDIADISSGKRPPMKQAERTEDVTIPLVGAASIMGYTNDVLYDSPILVTGRVGTHGVVQRFNEKCWPSDNTLVITTKRYEFVNQVLLGVDYKSLNRGSTQPLITQGDLKKTDIIMPAEEILDEFETLAGGLMKQYEKNIAENNKLAELRDSLLPKLMSGELDVSEIEM